MRFLGRNLAFAAISAFYCLPAMSQESDAGTAATKRICVEQDLSGVFALLNFRETPPSSESKWHDRFPYQYLAFYPQHIYSSIVLNKQVESSQKLAVLLAPSTPKQPNRSYTLSSDGVLNLYTGSKINYSYRCIVSVVDQGDFRKGDLIFTGYPIELKKGNVLEYGKSEFYKLYRRWY